MKPAIGSTWYGWGHHQRVESVREERGQTLIRFKYVKPCKHPFFSVPLRAFQVYCVPSGEAVVVESGGGGVPTGGAA